MPLTITIPGQDLYDQETGRFITTKSTTVALEHSLLSISKWESKWHKPYLSRDARTDEEVIDYFRCMCLTPNVDPKVFYGLTKANFKAIEAYIQDPMTATTIKRQDKKPSRRIITSEVIYYWMAQAQIPFDPCQKWHFNRLMMLLEVAAAESQPSKKMKPNDVLRQNHALNAARRAKHNTRG